MQKDKYIIDNAEKKILLYANKIIKSIKYII